MKYSYVKVSPDRKLGE